MKNMMIQIRATVTEGRQIYREHGIRAVFKRFGWKLIAGVFFYYLIRDVTLYIIIPALVIKSVTK